MRPGSYFTEKEFVLFLSPDQGENRKTAVLRRLSSTKALEPNALLGKGPLTRSLACDARGSTASVMHHVECKEGGRYP